MNFAQFWERVEFSPEEPLPIAIPDEAERKQLLAQSEGLMVMLIGPRGGGKTTAADWFVELGKEEWADIPRVSNVPMTGAIYVPDILRFLATKLVVEGEEKNYDIAEDNTVVVRPRKSVPAQMLVIVDEAAISGLEARGSAGSVLPSYLLALSRKLNINPLILISQLMSMTEKRGQWLSDYYWLCEAVNVRGTKILDHFRYRVYDADYHKTREYNVSREDAEAKLFGNFDSLDIPNYDSLAESYAIYYQIGEEDVAFYKDIRDHKKHIPKQPLAMNEINVLEKKWLRSPSGRYPGDTFLMDGRRYEVLQRDWNFDKGAYQYRAREIPNQAFIEQSPEEDAGVSA